MKGEDIALIGVGVLGLGVLGVVIYNRYVKKPVAKYVPPSSSGLTNLKPAVHSDTGEKLFINEQTGNVYDTAGNIINNILKPTVNVVPKPSASIVNTSINTSTVTPQRTVSDSNWYGNDRYGDIQPQRYLEGLNSRLLF